MFLSKLTIKTQSLRPCGVYAWQSGGERWLVGWQNAGDVIHQLHSTRGTAGCRECTTAPRRRRRRRPIVLRSVSPSVGRSVLQCGQSVGWCSIFPAARPTNQPCISPCYCSGVQSSSMRVIHSLHRRRRRLSTNVACHRPTSMYPPPTMNHYPSVSAGHSGQSKEHEGAAVWSSNRSGRVLSIELSGLSLEIWHKIRTLPLEE